MPAHDAESVLASPPEEWAEEDAGLVKRMFLQRRSAVPNAVASGLWRYWTQVPPRELLFDDPDDNRALVLHAKAFARPASRQDTGISDGPLPELLTELNASPPPPAPPPFARGPTAP